MNFKTHTNKVQRTNSFGFGEDTALATAPVGFGEETTYNTTGTKDKGQRNTEKRVRPQANRQHKTTDITGVKAFALGLGLNDDAFTLSLFPIAEVGERGTDPVPAAGLADLVKFPLDAGVAVPVAAGDPFEDTVFPVCPCPGVEIEFVFPFPPL